MSKKNIHNLTGYIRLPFITIFVFKSTLSRFLEFEEVWKPPTACHVIPFDFDIVCGVVFLGSMGFKVRILQSGMVSSVILL